MVLRGIEGVPFGATAGRVLLAPAPAFSTEDCAFDAAPNRSSYG